MTGVVRKRNIRRWSCAILAGAVLSIGGSTLTRAQIVQVTTSDDDNTPVTNSGFQLPKEDLKAVGKLEDFDRYVEKKAWELAFRAMGDLSDSDTQGMVPAADGFMVPMRRRIALSLKNLPAEGRDAYRLFYDADARQLWEKVQSGKISVGEETQTLQKIVTRFFFTSVGDVAADRLGDLYFEQGDFGNADGAWEQVIRDFPDSHLSTAKLQVKRCLALSRQGRQEEFAAAAALLKERYIGQTVTIGGQDVEVGAFVDSLAAPAPATQSTTQNAAPAPLAKLTLPTKDEPLWRVKAVLPETLEQMDQQLRNSGWGAQFVQFAGIIPPVAADEKRVYVNWLGVVYAVDMETGKMLWRDGKFTDVTAQPMNFVQSGVDPLRFGLELAAGKIYALVGEPRNNGNEVPYQMECLDPETGKVLWRSDRLGANVSLMTLPMVVGDKAYAAGSMRDETEYLMAFDPQKGTLEWKVALGKPQGQQNYRGQRDIETPTLQAMGGMVFVSTNNGALVAVNTAQHRVEWAFRCDTKAMDPYGNRWGWNGNAMINFATPGTLTMQDGTLYLKDSGGSVFYALDPRGPTLKWKREGISPEESLVAMEGQRAYFMGKELAAMDLKNPTPWKWNIDIRVTRGNIPPLETATCFYVATSLGIEKIDKDHQEGDPLPISRLGDHEAMEGRLMVVGDKLISVTSQAVSAYPLVPSPPPAAAAAR